MHSAFLHKRFSNRSMIGRYGVAGLAWLLMLLGLPVQIFAAQPNEAGQNQLSVSTNFPGGSGKMLEIDQHRRRIKLVPTNHPNRGWICWWYIHITGIKPGETITLDVGDSPWATPDRAAYSTDRSTWQQTSQGVRLGNRMIYHQTVNSRQAWFAWGPPFLLKDAEKLVRWAADQSPQAHAFQLCRTKAGYTVPALRFGVKNPSSKPNGIWIQARQHAWESGSCWVCQGLVQWLVSDDPRAAWLRNSSLITIVPIMDVDNVMLGAGGKNQHPRDHNRDWDEKPHWPSVAAAMQQIQDQIKADRFDLFVDLHNPGPGSKNPFYFITPRKRLSQLGNRNLDRFLAASQIEMTGPLVFQGDTRESGSQYDPAWRRISKNWVSLHGPGHVVALTLETAWNTPHSTIEGYQSVGRQLGLAIERYFRTAPREMIKTAE